MGRPSCDANLSMAILCFNSHPREGASANITNIQNLHLAKLLTYIRFLLIYEKKF